MNGQTESLTDVPSCICSRGIDRSPWTVPRSVKPLTPRLQVHWASCRWGMPTPCCWNWCRNPTASRLPSLRRLAVYCFTLSQQPPTSLHVAVYTTVNFIHFMIISACGWFIPVFTKREECIPYFLHSTFTDLKSHALAVITHMHISRCVYVRCTSSVILSAAASIDATYCIKVIIWKTKHTHFWGKLLKKKVHTFLGHLDFQLISRILQWTCLCSAKKNKKTCFC